MASKPPYRDEELLRGLYCELGWSTAKIANKLGCSDTAIRNWMEEHGIPRRNKTMAVAEANRVDWASHFINPGGYEIWEAWDTEEQCPEKAFVHHLIAIAGGANPYEVFDPESAVHHKSGHPRDNRPSNFEIMTRSEHTSHHNTAEIPECKHQLIQTMVIMNEERA